MYNKMLCTHRFCYARTGNCYARTGNCYARTALCLQRYARTGIFYPGRKNRMNYQTF